VTTSKDSASISEIPQSNAKGIVITVTNTYQKKQLKPLPKITIIKKIDGVKITDYSIFKFKIGEALVSLQEDKNTLTTVVEPGSYKVTEISELSVSSYQLVDTIYEYGSKTYKDGVDLDFLDRGDSVTITVTNVYKKSPEVTITKQVVFEGDETELTYLLRERLETTIFIFGLIPTDENGDYVNGDPFTLVHGESETFNIEFNRTYTIEELTDTLDIEGFIYLRTEGIPKNFKVTEKEPNLDITSVNVYTRTPEEVIAPPDKPGPEPEPPSPVETPPQNPDTTDPPEPVDTSEPLPEALPDTSDHTNTILWLILSMISAINILYMSFKLRKQEY
jgi:hypothetical protein